MCADTTSCVAVALAGQVGVLLLEVAMMQGRSPRNAGSHVACMQQQPTLSAAGSEAMWSVKLPVSGPHLW
jgi:hypothetical protein